MQIEVRLGNADTIATDNGAPEAVCSWEEFLESNPELEDTADSIRAELETSGRAFVPGSVGTIARLDVLSEKGTLTMYAGCETPERKEIVAVPVLNFRDNYAAARAYCKTAAVPSIVMMGDYTDEGPEFWAVDMPGAGTLVNYGYELATDPDA